MNFPLFQWNKRLGDSSAVSRVSRCWYWTEVDKPKFSNMLCTTVW